MKGVALPGAARPTGPVVSFVSSSFVSFVMNLGSPKAMTLGWQSPEL